MGRVESLLDLLLMENIGYLRHPARPLRTEELSLGRDRITSFLVERPPYDISKFVGRKFTILAQISPTGLAKLAYHPVVLLVLARHALGVREAVDGDLGREAVVGAESSFAAAAVAERCPGVVGRVERYGVLHFIANAASLHEGHRHDGTVDEVGWVICGDGEGSLESH